MFEISNCRNLLKKNPEIVEEIFYSNMISKEEFYKDPWKILNDPNLVVKYQNKLYKWKAAAPILLSIMTFGEIPSETVMKPLVTHKDGGLISFFKRKKEEKLNILTIDPNKRKKTPSSNKESVNPSEIIKQLEKIEKKTPDDHVKTSVATKSIKRKSTIHKRSFTPTSNQLKKLGLKKGRNEIRFYVTSKYQGTHSLITDLYLWESDSKIVISDVDGTITRSDILGQIILKRTITK